MKKVVFLLALLMVCTCFPAHAIESTAYTYTLSTDYWYIRTQDAYLPGSVILREVGLKGPEDLCLKGKTMYIADSGNGRIVRYDMNTGRVSFLGTGFLKQPTGVCVDRTGLIYVADYGAEAIVVLDESGTLQKTIGRPDALLYGATTPFKPQKVAVDSFGNLFATSEGTHEGILQFDIHGVFAGFFGANRTAALNLMEWFQDTFFTAAQKEKLLLRNPARIVNVDVSQENLVYSVTKLQHHQALKKLNLAGINILRVKEIDGEDNFVDVSVAPGGEMFAVTDTGAITEYDTDGRYLFAFGGRAASADRNGLTSVVSAIAVDDAYTLFVLDKQRGVVQPYAPTDFAKRIHTGLHYYTMGRYADAADIWKEFMRLTPRASFAHWGYGLALWQTGDYAQAKYHLELVNDLEYASDAFWEMRNEWLMAHLAQVIVLLVALCILSAVLGAVRKKHDFRKPVKQIWRRFTSKSRLLTDILFTLHMIRHPLDALYDLKHGVRGSVGSASCLYLLAFLVWLLDTALTARLFNNMSFGYSWRNPIIITSIAAIPVVLFVVGNYLISSINDGEGSMKNVYIGLAYSLSFYIIATPFVTLLSYGLTHNEAFLHVLLKVLILCYTFVLVFAAVKETHNYTVGGTIKNLLLTVCFIVLSMLAAAVLYMMWNELIGFVQTLIEEVRYRV